MGCLGMTIATINQGFPTPSASLVLGLELGDVFCFDVQLQVSTYLVKGLARLNPLQQPFQALGFLTDSRGMDHRNLLNSDCYGWMP